MSCLPLDVRIHICRAPSLNLRQYRYCRWCDGIKRHVLRDHTWWGWDRVCTGCGVVYDSDMGERARPAVGVDRRPLIRLWNEAMNKTQWREAVGGYMDGAS